MTGFIRHIVTVSILFLLSALTFVNAQELAPFVVVIDPGHGGKDSGCSGQLTNEKTIVLDVSKRLQKLISENFPEVKTVMTRADNSYLTLQERAAIANKANGNLFISIHVNSVDKKNKNRTTIHGASVYALGLHRSESNLSVAMRENSVMELEEDYTQAYQGFDPKSSESYIIFELSQNNHLNKSIEIANTIQHELITTAGRADKQVRQAGFWVLWATSMPSVLVELDFICNPDSERFMHSDNGKDKFAQALFNAFSTYYGKHKNDTHGPRVGKEIPKGTIAGNTSSDTTPESKVSKPKAQKSDITYHVQILSALKKIPKNDHEIKGVPDVDFFKDGKYYKYYSGSFSSANEAKQHLGKLKKRFPKAFVIKLKDGKPVK
ncbi:MAG: N-acetylmuramoyl-L-alanine amidase [Muribaculaceae bacterium]|nr:N-acetylmuramoyl-L-alanine amidase [Muribaculaceae bacterium]